MSTYTKPPSVSPVSISSLTWYEAAPGVGSHVAVPVAGS